jgi:hypothetical protein
VGAPREQPQVDRLDVEQPDQLQRPVVPRSGQEKSAVASFTTAGLSPLDGRVVLQGEAKQEKRYRQQRGVSYARAREVARAYGRR